MTGCVLIDVEGFTLTRQESNLLSLPQVAGVVLFAKNYDSRPQLIDLVHSIRHHCRDAVIFVDQEGGQVQRFGLPDFEAIPSAYALGQHGLEACREWGERMASALLSCGIDASFAPVLDLHDTNSPIIGQKERAFCTHAEGIIQAAGAFMDGMNAAGMQATGKHFPGHGLQSLDSHTAVIVSDQTLEDLEQGEMKSFIGLKDRCSGLMLAHIAYPNIDQDVVGRSKFWHHYIRQTLRFDGCLISDCLSMVGSAFDTIDERTGMVQYWVDKVRAFAKVCDLVILTHMMTDGAYDAALDVAKLEQILLTALPHVPDNEGHVDRMRGKLTGEFAKKSSSA